MNEPIHETANLALYKTRGGYEIHLSGFVHAVLVGKPKSEERGKEIMEALERYPENMRAFYNHR